MILITLAGIGLVMFGRAGASPDCTIALEPDPGTLAAFEGMGNSGNIPLSHDLGHFRTFAVTERFPTGQFYDGQTYRDLTASNNRLPLPDGRCCAYKLYSR